MGRRGYPTELRRRVLDLLSSGRRVAEVARDLQISEQTIYTWRRQDRIDRGLEPGTTSIEHAELAAARKRIRSMSNHGRGSSRHAHPLVGTNSRLGGLQAGALSVKLRQLDAWNRAGQAAASQYFRELEAGPARLVQVADAAESVHHLFVVRVPDRDAVREENSAGGASSRAFTTLSPVTASRRSRTQATDPCQSLSRRLRRFSRCRCTRTSLRLRSPGSATRWKRLVQARSRRSSGRTSDARR